MPLPVIITISLLVTSKFLDVLSTLGRIRSVNAESNPIARGLMKKVGIRKSVWLIFIISLVIILVTGYMALSSGITFSSLLCFFGGDYFCGSIFGGSFKLERKRKPDH